MRRSTTFPAAPANFVERRVCGPECPLVQHAGQLRRMDRLKPYQQAPMPNPSDVRKTANHLYQQLKPWQTRMIELLPDRYEATLKCRLLTVEVIDTEGVGIPDTSETIKFEALSYAWGSDIPKATIVCNDGRVLPIGENLADALVFLRREKSSRYLWCDAICINQSNIDEKALQVRNMLRIFEKADRVIAWIGLPRFESQTLASEEFSFNETNLLFSALNNWAVVNSIINDDFGPSGSHRPKCGEIARTIYETLVEHCVERQWFFRTWVRQEVFAAKQSTIQSGQETIDLEKFLNMLFKFASVWERSAFSTLDSRGRSEVRRNQQLHPPRTCHTLSRDLMHAGTDRPGYSLPARRRRYTSHWLRVLQDGTDFDVTDPRDRVYGALGMIQSNETRLYVDDRPEFRKARFPIDYSKTVSEVYQDVVKFLIGLDENLDVLTIFEARENISSDWPSWAPDWREGKERSFIDTPPNRMFDQQMYGLPTKQRLAERHLVLQGHQLGRICLLDAKTPVSRHTPVSWPLASHMDENYRLIILNGRTFVRGEYWTENSDGGSSTKVLLPRAAQLDDLVVWLQGGRTPFLLRPTSKSLQFKFLGPICYPMKDPEGSYKRSSQDLGDETALPPFLESRSSAARELQTFTLV